MLSGTSPLKVFCPMPSELCSIRDFFRTTNLGYQPFEMNSIKSMEVLFLGTGSSHTLPFLECTSKPDQACPACLSALQPEGERNIRGHTSCAVKVCFEDGSTKGLLIDCGMNTMQNAAKWFPQYGFKIDAVLLTHEHIDAIGGNCSLTPHRF